MWQDDIDSKVDLERVLGMLPEVVQVIVKLRGAGYSQREIGDRVGYSQQHISKILSICVKHLLKVHIEQEHIA